ncbi:amidase [uncultured Williamsia sp.]|uniref:amidase n=1 Tax=uncultured Williamsia sp. TaxID=259311 RepID=UPI00261AE4F1|nr:amidase [uncultured Williamsia sp.]
MDQDDYLALDATAMAAAVRRGEVSASDLLEAAIARADAVDPHIHAITRRLDDDARRRARGPLAGPLAGVPFLLKDLFQAQEGVVETAGSRSCAGAVAPQTDTVVARWLDAGAVVFGRTNVPEFGIKGTTEPELFGPTHNPSDLTRSPGGSSGGSAAAVAAGIVPVAGANDGGGSIRIPAACCGVFGLKPGRGVVPTGPGQGEFFHGGAVTGVVSRTVRDSAAFLDVIRGTDPVAPPYPFASPPRSYTTAAQQDPPTLRIGLQLESPLADGVDPEVVAAVRATADLLTEMGHTVTEARPAIDEQELAEDFLVPWFVHVAATVDELREHGARTDEFELDTRVLAALGRATSGVAYERSLMRWHTHVRALSDFHRHHDLLLTPTTATTAPPLGAHATSAVERIAAHVALRAGLGRLIAWTGAAQAGVLRNLRWVPFTQLANITGRPAVSLPLHQSRVGLPIGVQFVAPPGGEGLLFSLSARLEEALPWAGRRPRMPPTQIS